MIATVTPTVGSYVICIENLPYLTLEEDKLPLTVGKRYKVEDVYTLKSRDREENGLGITIINDDDVIEGYPLIFFTHLTLSDSDSIEGFFDRIEVL